MVSETKNVIKLVREITREFGFLSFEPNLTTRRIDERWVSFGSGSRMATIVVHRNDERLKYDILKIQLNLDELLLFKSQNVVAQPLKEFDRYKGIPLKAYDIREILVEKVRALITRKGVSARDIYDIVAIEQRTDLRVSDLEEEIMKKIEFALRFEKYKKELFHKIESLLGMRDRDVLKMLDDEGIPVPKDSQEEFFKTFNEVRKLLSHIEEHFND